MSRKKSLVLVLFLLFFIGFGMAHSFKVLDTDRGEMVYPADRYLEENADIGFSPPEFFKLGMDHIFSGTDHLLFLVSLLLIPSLLSNPREHIWSAVELVTAFTAGHALTIIASYYGVVSIPAVVVEGGIAASIAVTSLIAVQRAEREEFLEVNTESIIVVIVGFIHGLGFASTLNSLSIPSSQELILLASFNAGIEVAQVLILIPIIGTLYMSSKKVGTSPTVKLAATATFTVAAVWTVTRVIPVVGGIK